ARACRKYSLSMKALSPEARAALRAYRWPGNVRELNAVIERAVLMHPASIIAAAALGLEPSTEIRSVESVSPVEPAASERQQLSDVLAQTGWNISRTAAILGITRNTVRARIERYGLRPPERPLTESSEEPASDSEMPLDWPGRAGVADRTAPVRVDVPR